MRFPDSTDGGRGPRIREVFDAAVELHGDEQREFVDQTLHDDETLRDAVIRLLAADRLGTLEAALPTEARATAASVLAESHNKSFGPYRTTECIGAGGMGVVYKAVREDETYHKTVAIKILPGGLETNDRIERFRRERQILANLDHPNIARLLDGGATDEGLPYLVMEYVEGLPLDVYVEKTKVTVQRRLRLFLDICAAVEYAHRGLVVHCDLKPSNILVTADGTPKLLDFGIAKLLDEVGRSGTASAPLMTPEFASPEQVKGQPLTTASDQYSLGILLYLSVSGRRPYAVSGQGQQQVARAVCEMDLDLASSRNIPRDLRSVLAMATRKDPRRRYPSVEQFAADIERYLRNRPVVARRGNLVYRTARYIRRNRVILAVGVTCGLAVGLGIASSWSQSRRAERRFNELRGLAHFLVFETYDGITKLPGSTALRAQVVAKAKQYLDSLTREAADDPGLSQELVESYIRLGSVQGEAYGANLGDTVAALSSYRKAQTILEGLLRHDKTPKLQRQLCLLYWKLGWILPRMGRLDEAVDVIQRSVSTAVDLHAAAPRNEDYRWLLATSRVNLGFKMFEQADISHSVAEFRNVIPLIQASLDELAAPPQPTPRQEQPFARQQAYGRFYQSYAHWRLGDLTGDPGHFDEALRLQREGTAINYRLAEQNPQQTLYVRTIADNLDEIGYTLTKLRRYQEAEASFLEAISRFEKLAQADPSNVEAQKDIADACRYFASSLDQAGRRMEARRYARRALGVYQEILQRDPANKEVQKGLAEVKDLLTGNPRGQ
jgi:tetratricopeptide (TPR) repeat protein